LRVLARRLARLERQLAPAERKPKDYSLLVVTTFDHRPGLENATYTSYLCPNRIMMEVVKLNHATREEVSADEWNRWLEGKRAAWRENQGTFNAAG
jgi:hypothetical protein